MLVAMSPLDLKVQKLFLEYITEARKIYKTDPRNNHHSHVDSDVSIITHSLLQKFDEFRAEVPQKKE